jgi:hypothetical protein
MSRTNTAVRIISAPRGRVLAALTDPDPVGLFGILSGTLIRDAEGSKRKTQDEA